MNIEVQDELLPYLRSRGHVGTQETPRLCALRGGVSNRTVLVERRDGRAWVLKQSLPRLRVEVDWYCDLERTHREATGLRWLSRMIPDSVPDFIFEDRDHLGFWP